MRYELLRAKEPPILSELVNRYLAHGWRLVGGPIVGYVPAAWGNVAEYSQAVINEVLPAIPVAPVVPEQRQSEGPQG